MGSGLVPDMHMDDGVTRMVDCWERRYGSVLVGRRGDTLDVPATDSDVLTEAIVLLCEI